MEEKLRNSGIKIIGDIPWGTHFCQFYQTKEDLMNTILPYIKEGLENNEFCLWIISQAPEVEKAKEALKRAAPNIKFYLEKGQIEIIPYSRGSANEDISHSERVLDGLIEKLNQALVNGYDGLRLIENLLAEKESIDDFADYEKKLDRIIGSYRMIALCTYSLDNFSAAKIIEVIMNHQFTLIKREGKWEQTKNSRRRKAEAKIQEPANLIKSSDVANITKSLDGVITSWNRGEEQICYSAEENEEKYRSFIHNFLGIIYQRNEHFSPIFLNGAVEEITGYSEKEFISWDKWKEIIHPDDLSLVLKEEKKVRNFPSTGYGNLEYRIRHRDGRTKWVHEICQKINREYGKPEFYQGIIYDVTERKETEKFLFNIETARKKEIHHRIKNNLQVISSLLDLQAEKFQDKQCIKDSEVLKAFGESQNRVISMALIHEELYERGGTDTLNFSAYLRKLAENLFKTYSLRSKNVHLHMDLEENAFFNMDTAVPLGIIVNELVSNSLKYAFTENQEGKIRIRLCREEKNNETHRSLFSLTVSDNGKGIPDLELENVESLGLRLVSILVDQLEGDIKLKRDHGAEFKIIFEVTVRS